MSLLYLFLQHFLPHTFLNFRSQSPCRNHQLPSLQYACWNCFSSQSALEAEARLSSVCLPSGCKPMARISVSMPCICTPHSWGVLAPHILQQHLEVWWVVVLRARYVWEYCLLPSDHVTRLTCSLQEWSRFQGWLLWPLQPVLLSLELLQSHWHLWMLLSVHFPWPPCVGNRRPKLGQRMPDTHTEQ